MCTIKRDCCTWVKYDIENAIENLIVGTDQYFTHTAVRVIDPASDTICY
jgi:hypothetical protein